MNALQDSLFDPIAPIDRADQPRAGWTSRNPKPTQLRAAIALAPKSGTKRMQVLSFIAASGLTGITRQELADLHGLPIQSVCGRVRELLDGKFVYESGKERQGRAVLYATERGQRAVRNAS